MTTGAAYDFETAGREIKVKALLAAIDAKAREKGLDPERDALRMAEAAEAWTRKHWKHVADLAGCRPPGWRQGVSKTRDAVIAALRARHVHYCELGHKNCDRGECAEIAGARAEYMERAAASDPSKLRSCVECLAWTAGGTCAHCGGATWPVPGVCPSMVERKRARQQSQRRVA